MSILIKGLNMPEEGTYIDVIILDDGTVVSYDDQDSEIAEAVELADHGDLVDMDYIKDHWPNAQYFGAPVIITAERSEE